MALQPGRLLMALLIIVLLYLAGSLMDAIGGSSRVEPGEFEKYLTTRSPADYDKWLASQAKSRLELIRGHIQSSTGLPREEAEKQVSADNPASGARAALSKSYDDRLAVARDVLAKADNPEAQKAAQDSMASISRQKSQALKELQAVLPRPIFQASMHHVLDTFARGVQAILNWRYGFEQLTPQAAPNPDTVIGAIRTLFVSLPGWLWQAHRWSFLIYSGIALLIWSLLAGAITRQTIFEASGNRPIGATEAFRFVWQRWTNYLAAPLMPLALIGITVLAVAAYGFLFNFPISDLLASLLFFVALLAGVVMALMFIATFAGIHLMYPALSAEGQDAFSAASQAISFVLGRPWRFILYAGITVIYGAVTYLIVGLFIFLALYLTHWATGLWVFREAGEGVDRFQAILPKPEFGNLSYAIGWENLSGSALLAAGVVRIQVYLVIGLLAAYAISYYLSSLSIVYLLLRRKHDGTDIADVYEEPIPTLPADKIEPPANGAAPAAAPAATTVTPPPDAEPPAAP